jgi:hypothetical protein
MTTMRQPGRGDGRGAADLPAGRGIHDNCARTGHHEQESAQGLGKEPPPLESRIVEVERRGDLERE